MAEFCGTYTLVDNSNMKSFATMAFPNTLAKIAFHSGIVSKQLFELLAKTLCQLLVRKDECGTYIWTLTFDKDPHKSGDDVVESSNEEDSGLVFRIQYRLNEQFYITIPISGEKAKALVKRRTGNVNALEQITHLPSGDVEIIFTRTDTDLKAHYLHKATGTKASQIYKKNEFFER